MTQGRNKKVWERGTVGNDGEAVSAEGSNGDTQLEKGLLVTPIAATSRSERTQKGST